MRVRLLSVFKKYLLIIIAGAIYLIWVLITDIRIPCVFNLIFKLYCPGCGITRMIAALARLDFRSAYLFNPFIFLTFPIILLLIVYSEIAYIRTETHSIGKLTPLLWLELIGAIIFGVMRNIT